jgi:hypothetical protein
VLDETGALQKIVEIPKLAATQSFGGLTYTISTFVEGMDEPARTATASDGTVYAVAALPAGSTGSATDESGLTYTVVAVAEGLQPLQPTASADGAEYAVAADGKGFTFADTSKEGFCFKAVHYDDAYIHSTMHNDELVAIDETIVSVDYKFHCDNLEYASLEPWRKFEEKEFSFSYDIIPE